MKDIKPGFRFINNGMDLTIICFIQKEDTNLALAVCSNDGLFITFRNLQKWQGGYTWDWGHYFQIFTMLWLIMMPAKRTFNLDLTVYNLGVLWHSLFLLLSIF